MSPETFEERIRQHEADLATGAAALEQAAQSVGSVSTFMDAMGVARRQFYEWRKHGIPADRLADAVRIAPTVSAAMLRPDLARVFRASETGEGEP